jgi:hypothetical protein
MPGDDDLPVDVATRLDLVSPAAHFPSKMVTSSDESSRAFKACGLAADRNRNLPATPAQFRYESISIASPGAEETLWNIEGVLNVSVSVSPGLQDGHRLRAYFDGQERMVSGTNFTIDEVYRGVHNLQVEVIDATGKLMIRSQPNRFYVQQNMIKR